MTNLSKLLSKKIFLLAAGLFALVILITILELTNVTHFFHSSKPAYSGSSYTKGETTNGSTNSSGSSSSNSSTSSDGTTNSQPGDQKSNSGGDSSVTLLAPSGDFVSNHHPSLSNTPNAPNTMTSVCTTTPGAACTISFTKDGVTQVLAGQTTDRGGSTYWNWKLQDLSLTAGTWIIKATATLNGKSLSTGDALQLVVAP